MFHPALKLVISCFFFLLLIGNWTLLIESGNWYQQFMPNLNGRQVVDITFTDSLDGYAVTTFSNDTSFILRTTNSGDNWFVSYSTPAILKTIQFINQDTGFASGQDFLKTTNSGNNWSTASTGIFAEDTHVLNYDTAWYADPNGLVGGVFFTSNGGASWQNRLFLGSQNPTNIYFYNKDTGYTAENILYKTTNSGQNWAPIPGGGFSDMFFINGTTGWKCSGTNMNKTTDGGLSWVNQTLPTGGNILISQIIRFDNVVRDTIWGVGSTIMTGVGSRGTICRTTNGGNNWLFQVPDSNINIFQYQHIEFISSLIGWAYTGNRGMHTTAGGDPIWLTGIKKISTKIPEKFKLYQNYPNPFNPRTVINYELKVTSYVKLSVNDEAGRHIIDLVNQKLDAGTYEVDFSGIGFSSGVYFYSLFIDSKLIGTRKMILIK